MSQSVTICCKKYVQPYFGIDNGTLPMILIYMFSMSHSQFIVNVIKPPQFISPVLHSKSQSLEQKDQTGLSSCLVLSRVTCQPAPNFIALLCSELQTVKHIFASVQNKQHFSGKKDIALLKLSKKGPFKRFAYNLRQLKRHTLMEEIPIYFI